MTHRIPCYIFDIDGTIADCLHRLHHIEKSPKDWDAFFAACHLDKPIEHIRHIVCALFDAGVRIVYVTARPGHIATPTIQWLAANGYPNGPLYMRQSGDRRPDSIIKSELIDVVRSEGLEPIMAFEDRSRVVAMWRARGIPCAQVREGDF